MQRGNKEQEKAVEKARLAGTRKGIKRIREEMPQIQQENEEQEKWKQNLIMVGRLAGIKEGIKRMREEIAPLVTCPVCFNIPGGRLMNQCLYGHMVCDSCHTVDTCPTCRVHLPRTAKVRCLVASQVIDKFYSQCAHRCGHFRAKEDLDQHEDACVMRLVPCPKKSCNLTMTFQGMADHVTRTHREVNSPANVTMIDNRMTLRHRLHNHGRKGRKIGVYHFDNKVFYVKMCIKLDKWYTWLHVLGGVADAEQYKVKISFNGPDMTASRTNKVFPIDEEMRSVLLVSRQLFSFTSEHAKECSDADGKLAVEYELMRV